MPILFIFTPPSCVAAHAQFLPRWRISSRPTNWFRSLFSAESYHDSIGKITWAPLPPPLSSGLHRRCLFVLCKNHNKYSNWIISLPRRRLRRNACQEAVWMIFFQFSIFRAFFPSSSSLGASWSEMNFLFKWKFIALPVSLRCGWGCGVAEEEIWDENFKISREECEKSPWGRSENLFAEAKSKPNGKTKIIIHDGRLSIKQWELGVRFQR